MVLLLQGVGRDPDDVGEGVGDTSMPAGLEEAVLEVALVTWALQGRMGKSYDPKGMAPNPELMLMCIETIPISNFPGKVWIHWLSRTVSERE